jgi:hypothetical protein
MVKIVGDVIMFGETPMRAQSRKPLSISAAMLLLLSSGFSCSYGDDDDVKKHEHKKTVETTPPQHWSVPSRLVEHEGRVPATFAVLG